MPEPVVPTPSPILYHTVIPPPAPRTGDKDHQPKPAHRGTEGVGQGPGEGRQRASWRRPSSPQARKDRRSWKSRWSWDQAPSSCPGASRAARSTPPNPSSALPARPPWLPLGVPSSPHPRAGRVGQGDTLGPGTSDRQPTPGKDAGQQGHSHGHTHLRAVFLTLTLPPSTNRAPSRVYQNKRPDSQQCPGQDRTASQAGLQAQPPSPASRESHDPVISGGPGMCSILGPEGSDVTRCPLPGLQALPGLQELPRG